MVQTKELLSDAVQTESKNKRKLATKSSSFKRCRATIQKKAFELSTLCDTPVCVVIYGPHDNVPSLVWPTDPRQLRDTLNRYLHDATKPVEDCKKNKVEGGLVLKGATVDNTQVGVGVGVIDGLSGEQLVELGNRLESKIADVDAKIDAIKRAQNTNTTVVLDFDQNVDYCCGAVEELQMPPTTTDGFSDLFGDELWDVGMIPPMETYCPSSTSELESVQRCCEQTNMMTATTSTTSTDLDLIPDMKDFEFDRFLEDLQRGDFDKIMAEFYNSEQQIQINDENVNVGDHGCCELMVRLNSSTDGFDFVTIPDECSIPDSQFPVQAQQFDAGLHQFQNEIVTF